MKKAIFPGSFDPITLGHLDIIKRSVKLFDQIIIAIGTNYNKENMFSLDKRKKMIEETLKGFPCVSINTYKGLTIDFCKEQNAKFILRGIRNISDFEFEKSISQTNFKLSGIETIFLTTNENMSYISSNIVRDLILNKAPIESFVPKAVIDNI